MTDRPNIVLITIDCLRSDHVSCYGYSRETTPNIDRLARAGLLYKNCMATSCWTLPSMASLNTGLFPSTHGAHDEHQFLDEKWDTLATILANNGYQTAGIVTVPWLTNAFGMARGFESLIELKENKLNQHINRFAFFKKFQRLNRARYNYSVRCRDAQNVSRKFKSLVSNLSMSEKPFFIHCHYFDCHPPYIPPKKFIEKFCSPDTDAIEFNLQFRSIFRKFMQGDNEVLTEKIRKTYIDLYDASIAYIDRCIGEQVNLLTKKNKIENTLILIAADHGILFGEHGLLDHNFNLYNSVLHVPLILYYPAVITKGQTIESMVQNTDILPSIMDTAKIRYSGELHGDSILPHKFSENHRFAYSELFINQKRQKKYGVFQEKRVKAIQNTDYKYIQATDGKKEFYNLKKDPCETNNLMIDEFDLARQFEKEIFNHETSFFNHKNAKDGSEFANMTDAVEQRLKDLGYL